MESSNVYVTNLDNVNGKLVDLVDRLDSTLSSLDSMSLQLKDIQIYIRVFTWVIFFLMSCYVTNWLWKTWIKGLVRSYFKLPL